MNTIEEANDEIIEYCDDFKAIYASAKVRNSEVLCAKGMIILPFFVATKDELTDKIVTYSLTAEQLKGTGYSNFEISGITLNGEQHLSFWRYMNAVSQKTGISKVVVSIKEMLPYLKKTRNDLNTYTEYFEEFLNRIRHGRVRYTINSKLKTIDLPFIGKIEYLGTGVYSINIGGLMVESLLSDTYIKKVGISNEEGISGGTARLLKEKISSLIFKDCGSIRVELLYDVLKMKYKSKEERDASNKTLNSAIKNLTKVGFILGMEDLKHGGKTIIEKKFWINNNFNDKRLDDLEDEPFTFEHVKTSNDVQIQHTPLPTVNLNEAMAKIEAQFNRMSLNPDEIILPSNKFSSEVKTTFEIDGWNEEPDFEEWEDGSSVPHRAMSNHSGPYKEWPGEDYSEFDE